MKGLAIYFELSGYYSNQRMFLLVKVNARRFTVQLQAAAGDLEAVHAEQNAFLEQLDQANITFSIRFQYTHALNAISIDIPDNNHDQNNNVSLSTTSSLQDLLEQQNFLTRQPLVRQYWPGKRYPRPQSLREEREEYEKGTPNLSEAHGMTGVQNVTWTGKGIKLAILDTGVDYTHPALGGCFGDGCRITHGFDLVGDHYGEGGSFDPVPDPDPMDACDGHGTHVAGIIAASGDDQDKPFVGVAPDVELGVWRIFGCEGDTDDDIILEAAERAVHAGSNIINLSLGGDKSAWQEDALAVALSSMGDLGIMVVVAQGNEGRDGIARTPSPSIGRHVMAASSVDNKIKLTQGFRINDKDAFFEYRLSDDSLLNPFPDHIRLVLPNSSHITNGTGPYQREQSLYGCQPYQTPFEEKSNNAVVLVKRGGCSFVSKALNVQNAGAAGMLVYQESASYTGNKKSEPPISVGFKSRRIQISIGSIESGVLTLFNNNTTYLDAEQANQILDIPSAGLISSFSTWGPDAELHLKPDLAAVGGNVYSTFPMNLGKYKTMSGTSMATVGINLFWDPYLSGCIALYMQATGSRSPGKIFQALLNHAKPVVTHHNQNRLESPIKQGAGLVQIHSAILGSSTVSPYKLELNDTQFLESEKILRVRNKSAVQRIYHLEHLPAAAIAGYDFDKSAVPRYRPLHVNANATIHFKSGELTLEPNSTQVVHLRFIPPHFDPFTTSPHHQSYYQHLLYGGYIKVSSKALELQNDERQQGEEEHIHIPYLGALDNQRDLPLFDTMKGYPRIEPIDKSVYNFQHHDRLYLHIRLGSPTARLRSVLVNQENKRLGTLVDGYQKWVSRNDHSDNKYTLVWDGRIILPPSIPLLSSSSAPTSSQDDLNNSMVMGKQHRNHSINHSNQTMTSVVTQHQHFGKKKATVLRRVPPGKYKIRVSALKIFGDPLLKEDWEIWYSPEFEII